MKLLRLLTLFCIPSLCQLDAAPEPISEEGVLTAVEAFCAAAAATEIDAIEPLLQPDFFDELLLPDGDDKRVIKRERADFIDALRGFWSSVDEYDCQHEIDTVRLHHGTRTAFVGVWLDQRVRIGNREVTERCRKEFFLLQTDNGVRLRKSRTFSAAYLAAQPVE